MSLHRTPGAGFVRNGGQHYDCENALGSSVAVRDASGALVGLTQYDAFGREVFSDVGVDRGDFRFGGAHGYVNDYSGMQLLGARYYIPALGRFLTQDPLGHAGGPNLYAYCANSPLMGVDPDGMAPQWIDTIKAGTKPTPTGAMRTGDACQLGCRPPVVG